MSGPRPATIESPKLAERGLSHEERAALRSLVDREQRRRAGLPLPPDPEGDREAVRCALAAAGPGGLRFAELARIVELPGKRVRGTLGRMSTLGQIERVPGLPRSRPLWRLAIQ